MGHARGLTELESCTLGVIHHHQPCSAYEVRRVFARSPTWEWSASAGTVYPVIERLIRLKMVRAESGDDGRGRRDLTVTAKGLSAIQGWVQRLELRIASPTPDPIRTRAYFLASLETASARATFVVRAEALTREMIRALRARARVERDISEADFQASLGALFELDGRLRWLRALRRGHGSRPGKPRGAGRGN